MRQVTRFELWNDRDDDEIGTSRKGNTWTVGAAKEVIAGREPPGHLKKLDRNIAHARKHTQLAAACPDSDIELALDILDNYKDRRPAGITKHGIANGLLALYRVR